MRSFTRGYCDVNSEVRCLFTLGLAAKVCGVDSACPHVRLLWRRPARRFIGDAIGGRTAPERNETSNFGQSGCRRALRGFQQFRWKRGMKLNRPRSGLRCSCMLAGLGGSDVFLAIGASELLRGFSASGRYNADPGSARASAWYYVVVQFVAARPHLPLHPTASESESCSTGHGRVQTPSRDPILTGSGGSGTVGVHARTLSPVRTAVLPGPTALSYDAGGCSLVPNPPRT